MGELIGGIVGVYILHVVWEFLLFKRVFDDPVKGKLASVFAAYLTASIVFGFASANGGPFQPVGFIVYLLGAIVVGVLAYRRGLTVRKSMVDQDEMSETFS